MYSTQSICQDVAVSQRSYRSPLREDHTRRTRELILDALVGLVGSRDTTDLNIAELANRAGVSPRTVYRHFPDREALLAGLSDHLDERGVWTVDPSHIASIDDLHEIIPLAHRQFEDRLTETRALVALNLAGSAQVSRSHRATVVGLAQAWFTDLDPDDAAAVGALLHLLMSSRTWVRLRDEAGLDADRAGRALEWAVQTLTSDLTTRTNLDV